MVEFKTDTPLNTGVNFLRNVAITGSYVLLVSNFSKKVAIPAGIALSAAAGALRSAHHNNLKSTTKPVALYAGHDALVHTLEVGLLFGMARGISAWPTAGLLKRIGTSALIPITLVWSTSRITSLHGLRGINRDGKTRKRDPNPLDFIPFSLDCILSKKNKLRPNHSFNTAVNFLVNVAATGTYALLAASFSKKVSIPLGITVAAATGFVRTYYAKMSNDIPRDDLYVIVPIHDAIVRSLDVALLFGMSRLLTSWSTAGLLRCFGTIGLGTLATGWATLRIAGLHGLYTGGPKLTLDSPLCGVIDCLANHRFQS